MLIYRRLIPGDTCEVMHADGARGCVESSTTNRPPPANSHSSLCLLQAKIAGHAVALYERSAVSVAKLSYGSKINDARKPGNFHAKKGASSQ